MAFDIPVGERGDNYDRYMVRMREMDQSLRIIEQCAAWLEKNPAPLAAGAEEPALEPDGAIREARRKRPSRRIALSPNLKGAEKSLRGSLFSKNAGWAPPAHEDAYTTMEGLIAHFQFYMKGHGFRPPKGEAYFSVEGGNGELGFYIVSDGTDQPYRLHVRAPCFHVVAALEELIRGRMVADVIPTFGSMNMIGGELDR